MEYRRCQGKSYMILESEEMVSGYETAMLRENTIRGFLPMEQSFSGEHTQYWYDISGKEDLAGYVRYHKLDRRFLKTFLVQLSHALDKIGGYLLIEDGVSLCPEMIYLSHDRKEIAFCYLPMRKTSIDFALRDFMEFFIKHMEHGTQSEIEVCYDVYEICQSEHICMESLIESVMRVEDEPVCKKQSDLEEDREDELEEEEKMKVNIVGKWFRRQREKQKERQTFFFEPEDFKTNLSEETQSGTVLLGSECAKILGELRYEGDGRESNFKIEKELFIIGSKEEETDGCIHASSVSRQHARLIRENDSYYIEDLNSTNGTYVNGESLNYKQKVQLLKNDKVAFADETYRFV